jgi:hypothetical protein
MLRRQPKGLPNGTSIRVIQHRAGASDGRLHLNLSEKPNNLQQIRKLIQNC